MKKLKSKKIIPKGKDWLKFIQSNEVKEYRKKRQQTTTKSKQLKGGNLDNGK